VRFSRLTQAALILVACALAACGGGNDRAATPPHAKPAADSRKTTSAAEGTPSVQSTALVVERLNKVGERRLSRTVWEYTYTATVRNAGSVAGEFVLDLASVPSGSVIIDGTIATGPVPALGSATTADTVTLQHDRTLPFDVSKLTWKVTPSSTHASVVTLPDTLPEAVRSSIAGIVSFAGEGLPGQALKLPPVPAGGAALVMALDSAGEMRLAGYANTPSTPVNASSTALVLTSIAIGMRSDKGSFTEAKAWIESAASFPRLVAETERAISANTIPAGDPRVASAIHGVIADLQRQAAAQAQAATRKSLLAGAGARAKAWFSGRGDLVPIRIIMLSPLPSLTYVGVTGGNANTIDVTNRLPIAWSMKVHDQNRQPLGTHVLRPAEPEKLLFGSVAPSTLPTASGTGVYLELSQTNASRASTVGSLISSGVATALVFAMSHELWKADASICFGGKVHALAVKKLAKAGFEKASLEELLGDLLKPSEMAELAGMLVDCGVEAGKDQAAIDALSKVLGATMKSVKHLAFAFDAFQVGTFVWQLYVAHEYWTADTVGARVCRNLAGELDGCVSELRLAKASVVALEGVDIDALEYLKAFDKSGNEVGLPAGLQLTTEGPVQLTSGTTTVRTMSVGSARITATDPFSGKSSPPLTVDVVNPSIEILSGTLKVGGGPIMLGMRDAQGREVLMPANSSWELELGRDVFQHAPLIDWLTPGSSYPKRLVLAVKRAGDSYVQFTNGATGKAVQRRLAITDSASATTHWVLDVRAPTSATPLPPDLMSNPFTVWNLEPPFRVFGTFVFFNGSSGVRYYFDDDSPEVVQELLGQVQMKVVQNRGWRSYHTAFQVDTDVHYEQMLQTSEVENGTWKLRKHVTSGTRSTVMRVTSRTPNALSGTYSLTTISGAFKHYNAGGSDYDRWTTVPTEASGTWTATRLNGPAPRPVMNGYGNCALYCYGGSSCGGFNDSQCGSTMLPMWCGPWVPNTCRY
jgi:hypothetical protein